MSPGGPLAIGARIGPYEIVGWLGAGGMGDVYRARDARLGRDVAVKVIAQTFASDVSRVHRFEQEARAAGQLNHPNILAVHDAGTHDGAPYIVAELLEGESLRSRLQGGVLPPRKAIEYARQTAEGLAAAHDKGIVHRDVKPDNLFVTSDGRIKILDFGIAKLTTSDVEGGGRTGVPTDTAAGTVVGTAGYMSPEQVRGEVVDARSDIFSLGVVLHEMMTGRAAFTRGTTAETMAAILNDEAPDLDAAKASPALVRTITRCLEKAREARFQSARDLAFGLEVLSGTHATATPGTIARAARRWGAAPVIAAVLVGVVAVLASWLARKNPPALPDDPFITAKFSRLTNWPGAELGAEISPDGRYVAFISDKEGEFDLWISQIGTGEFFNLTRDRPSLLAPGATLRTFGFSGDGSHIWMSTEGDAGGRKVLLPIGGGTPRSFLGKGDAAPAWSHDGNRLVYLNNKDGDPFYVAERSGADPKEILGDLKGHNHNPAWSPDGEWIYFVHGVEPTAEMDIWRVRPNGESREQLTHRSTALNYLAVLDRETVLYVARDRDRSGPWLWTLDVPSKVSRRVVTGLDHYIHVSASGDGRRIVATASTPTTDLWRVPILDRVAEDSDTTPYPVPTDRAVGPRFRGASLFYLSARGTANDGLWRVDPGEQLSQVWNGMDGELSEPASVSPDGSQVVVIIRDNGKRRLMIMDADGTHPRTLAGSIDIQGAAGQAAADWSPDGRSIVAGGIDQQGAALFLIPVDGGALRRLLAGRAESPVWSPDGQLILYSGPYVSGQSDLLAIRPDGSPFALPPVKVRQGGYRFLPDSKRIVYLATNAGLDFRMLDLGTKTPRLLTRFSNRGLLQTFDVTPDGQSIVFDRARPNADVVLIELPK